MTLTLYVEREDGLLITSATDGAAPTLPPFYAGMVFTMKVFIVEAATVVDVTGKYLRVGIGTPAGSTTPIAQQLTFTVEGSTAKNFTATFSCNTAEFIAWVGDQPERSSFLEIEISDDGVTWDKLVQTSVRCVATLFEAGTSATVVGPTATIDNTDSPYTVAANVGVVLCDTTAGAISVTLPASPVDGQIVKVKDAGGLAATNAITVAAGAKTIDGQSNALVADNWSSIEMVWSSAMDGWFLI
jgi:hypothetical protein